MSDTLIGSIRRDIATLPESGIVEVVNYGRERSDIIALWAGEGDKPTPDFISDAAMASLRNGETFYTYQRGIPELREALARYHARIYGAVRSAENFYVTGSGMQAIMEAVQCVLGAGDEVIVPTPCWPNILGAVQVAGGKVAMALMTFGNNGWQVDLDTLFAARTEKTKAIFVNSPGNPTGALLSRDELIAIRDFARAHDLWIIADEVYGRFTFDNKPAASFLEITGPDEKIIVVNTFSKNWAMTGWRTGWVIVPEALGQVMENLVQYNTSGVPVFLQRGCVVALEEGEAFLKAQVEEVRLVRDMVCKEMATWPRVSAVPPQGAFYLFFAVEGEPDSRALALRLIDEASVGLAPGGAFGEGGEGFLRLCLAGSANRFEDALARLRPVLGKP
jgi:aspartate/methionine/tyrosine aminotransferase